MREKVTTEIIRCDSCGNTINGTPAKHRDGEYCSVCIGSFRVYTLRQAEGVCGFMGYGHDRGLTVTEFSRFIFTPIQNAFVKEFGQYNMESLVRRGRLYVVENLSRA